MNRTKYLKGQCQHCQGRLEFLAEHTGMRVPCPHCGQETDLLLPPPPQEPALPRRTIIWTAIAILVLVLGLGGALLALQRAQRWAASQRHQNLPSAVTAPTNAPATEPAAVPSVPGVEGLQASAVSLDHVPGSSLVYAVGSITNQSTSRRFGLKVQVGLSDQAGHTVGNASDYRPVLEPGEAWQFKALVVDPKAVSARIVSIHEDQ